MAKGEHSFADTVWSLPRTATGSIQTWEAVQVAVLMDIRHELQVLNGLLGCSNFTAIPAVLRSIRRNTAKPRKAAKRKA